MHVVFVKSSDNPRDVLQRLHSTPLYVGLRELGVSTGMAVLDSATVDIAPPSHAVIHYNDRRAIAAAFELRKSHPVKILCLCADVYELAPYRWLAESVDLFLAPTPLHRQVIQSAVMKPVAVLPEAIDPIALPGQGTAVPVACNNRLCWFGYPESFGKSMGYLLPDAFARSSFDVKLFTIITDTQEPLWQGAVHKPFTETGFYRDAADCGYALLSHFAYDLQLNSFIKSPNKLLTALVRGMVPLASATPSYWNIARNYGLEPLLFDGPLTLSRLLKTLDCARDRARFGLEGIGQDLREKHSNTATARRFLDLIS
ncbi:hypothetical protein [Aestuariivirga sp.]|uniref:hypothetical protein n=1 Tax=Aestuariivirga sp. TaxID=2650926 RepID=UPI003BAA57FB